MEVQLHPASGRGSVRTLTLGPRSERALQILAGLWALLAVSLLWTGPSMALRWLRHGHRADIDSESERLAGSTRQLEESAAALRGRAVAAGDRLTRIAFLYDVPPSEWPRTLDPEAGVLAPQASTTSLTGLERYVAALERARLALARVEQRDRGVAGRVPSILPIRGSPFATAALFGPRVSPWTGETEFFPGVELATSAGTPVIAPGGGRVAFAGRVRPGRIGWLWRVGNVVVLDHGDGIATAYGHLARTSVRAGQRVERGDPLGVVGATGWAMVPQLHYELWRRGRGGWRPIDPLYAILDHRLDTAAASLERMRGATAPDPVEALPGVR